MMDEVAIGTNLKLEEEPAFGRMKGNLTDDVISPTGTEKVLSRYLSASMGTCHDLCKSGMKHDSETIKRSTTAKKDRAIPDRSQILVRNIDSALPKEKSNRRPKPSSDIKSHVSSTTDSQVVKTKKATTSLRRASSLVERTKVSIEHIGESKPKSLQIKESSSSTAGRLTRRHSDYNSLEGTGDMTMSPSKGPRRASSGTMIKEIRTSRMSMRTGLPFSSVSSSPKHSMQSLSTKSWNVKNTSKLSCLNNLKTVGKGVENHAIDANISEKALYVVDLKDKNQNRESGDCSPNTQSFEDFSNVKNGVQATPLLQSSENEDFLSIQNDMDINYLRSPSSPTTCSIGSREIQVGSYDSRSSSSSSRMVSPRSPASELMHGEENGPDSECNATNGPKKARHVPLGPMDHSSQMMKFKSGKVYDFCLKDPSPRRLRFRQGEALGENQNDKNEGRRILRRTTTDIQTYKIEIEAVKVPLRHQSLEINSSSQQLFNNVIEETTRKLAESRTSKVKTLVDAFETVFSLQDGKSPRSCTD